MKESLQMMQIVKDQKIGDASIVKSQIGISFNIDTEPADIALGPFFVIQLSFEVAFGAIK